MCNISLIGIAIMNPPCITNIPNKIFYNKIVQVSKGLIELRNCDMTQEEEELTVSLRCTSWALVITL
jgi:hypothetical protein